ncbi:hypothetical protein BOSE127_170173 [Bosea sp. 127]|nr:hypothetical protein BOSE127_170173 [Bosea sp. 127]
MCRNPRRSAAAAVLRSCTVDPEESTTLANGPDRHAFTQRSGLRPLHEAPPPRHAGGKAHSWREYLVQPGNCAWGSPRLSEAEAFTTAQRPSTTGLRTTSSRRAWRSAT